MDKAQKELVKSYYHARNIAMKEEEFHYGLEKYEINDKTIKLINPSTLPIGNVEEILSNHPQHVEYFKNRIPELEGIYVRYILMQQPQLLPYFIEHLDKLDYLDAMRLINKNPQNLKYLTKFFDKKEINGITLYNVGLGNNWYDINGDKYNIGNAMPYFYKLDDLLEYIRKNDKYKELSDVLRTTYIRSFMDILSIKEQYKEYLYKVNTNREYDHVTKIIDDIESLESNYKEKSFTR